MDFTTKRHCKKFVQELSNLLIKFIDGIPDDKNCLQQNKQESVNGESRAESKPVKYPSPSKNKRCKEPLKFD